MGKKSANNGKKTGKDPKTGQFVEGNNYGGQKEKGTLDFKTRWLRFIDWIAEQEKVSPEDIEKRMDNISYKQILSGKFPYWKDINDRVYGQANQPMDFGFKPELQQALEKLSQIIK